MPLYERLRAAIIGTREPDECQEQFAARVSQVLSTAGIIIKTGGAGGLDHIAMTNAFVPSIDELESAWTLEVYLPWQSYNSGLIPIHAKRIVYDPKVHITWGNSVRDFHPAYNRLTRGARALHARNYGIIEGTKFIVACPDEKGEGGTGQGIRVARGLGIPVFEFRRGSKIHIESEVAKIMEFANQALQSRPPVQGESSCLAI